MSEIEIAWRYAVRKVWADQFWAAFHGIAVRRAA